MEKECSFAKIVGGVCGVDQRYKHDAAVVPLSSCKHNISEHLISWGIEVDLILAHASIFSLPRDISSWKICPAHRSRLGIGWRRGTNRCCVPALIAKHTQKRIPERGISKSDSKRILKYSRIFIPVGSGK